MFGAILYILLFAQEVLKVSATHSGLILTHLLASLIISSALSGQIISHTEKYKVISIIGISLITLGMYLLSLMNSGANISILIFNMILIGAGLGTTLPIFTVVTQSAFIQEKIGQVTASPQLFRGLGGVIGTTILGGVLSSKLLENPNSISEDIGSIFFISTLVMILSFCVILFLTQIEIRKTMRSLKEVEMEFETELTQAGPKDEPNLTN